MVWEMRLEERRDRACAELDMGDDDMEDWSALSMSRSLAADPLTDIDRDSPSDKDAIDDRPDVVVICATAASTYTRLQTLLT